uniref:Cell wall hydrolase autolysin n=1 Tax=Dulem virus 36 TaxID=3145754 RepID=A0AAU8B1W4_9CAUD
MAQKKVSDIKIININAGHTKANGNAPGAVGILNESTEARNVKNKVVTMLRILGKTVNDCTVDDAMDANNCLDKIVKLSNSHKADLFISIHLNSGANDKNGNGKTTGVEVFTMPNSTVTSIAEDVCSEIAKLGFKNRGVKTSPQWYVVRKTDASAMLIECCFVDDKDDAELFDSTKMAEAIVKAVTGKTYKYGTEQQVSSSPTVNKTFESYVVRITASVLNVRKGPSTKYDIVTTVKKNDAYTIVEEMDGWGRLKSDAGWISLAYTERIKY